MSHNDKMPSDKMNRTFVDQIENHGDYIKRKYF